ncbi:MAG: ion transporter, partial [Cyclobacteriaceae bacterium]|nr:ion transporter [Cyclobacteriaceae bacterium]
MTFRERLHLILDPNEKGGKTESIFEFILITIIILNIVAIVLASIKEEFYLYQKWFHYFELFSVIFFTLEYFARLYAIVENPEYKNPVTGRLRYAKTGMAIVDLLAFLPFYLSFLPIDLRFMRILRLMALFRMFKITRYMQAL